MAIQSSRHRAVLEELTEWWEDLRDPGTGSRVVLVPVPRRWGRSRVLEEFRGVVEDLDGSLVFSISGTALAGRAVQAQELSAALTAAELGSRAARLLGLDTVAGEVQLGLGIGGLFISGLADAVPVLLTSLAMTAAGNAWDASPLGQQGAVVRAARAVAAVSVAAPVLVTVDDAELLDLGLAVTMIENLADRYDGHVLVVATVMPESDLEAELLSPGRYELLGRVHKADADPDMSYGARAALAQEAGPDLPNVAVERIAQRTRNFAEVFAVCGVGKLADLAQEKGAALLAAVDTVIDAAVDRAKVSAEATVLAWAGGVLLIRQADRALEALGAGQQHGDLWVTRSAGLARLTDPASPRLTEQVATLAARTRCQLAAIVLEEAISIGRDPDATLVEQVIALQAAHRVRSDLDARGQLTQVQCALIRGLEKLGDPAAAYQVAATALAELPADEQGGEGRREILTAVLRLARTRPRQDQDPVIEEAIALALSGGAVLGLEAQVWAAVDLLDRAGRREAALKLADQVTAELAKRPGTEATANQWRLLLAFRIGRAGYPGISQRLLAPMINAAATGQQEAAQAVLYAIGGPRADIRLQIIILEAELAATPPDADDDLLRLHNALAADYDTLGDYRSALQHGWDELTLRQRLQGPDHRQTLTARAHVADWTGRCGDSAGALRLYRELLPDLVRVLGPDHPDTLAARGNLAAWTSERGDSEEALRLFRELLPDLVRVLGPDHPDTLAARGNLAAWTSERGHSEEALHLYRELLPGEADDRRGVYDRPAMDRGEINVPQQERRYLRGQCSESISVGEPFSLLASIVLRRVGGVELKTFDVLPEGRDVLLVVHAPGLRLLGRQRLKVHVPADGDSEPVMFELQADAPGTRRVSVTAWLAGSYLGELLVEITAERDRPPTSERNVLAEINTEPADGAVGLVVRYDPVHRAYRFEFRDEDNPDEVTSNLAYEPGPRVEQLVADLDDLAKGRSGYSAAQTRRYLVEAGAGLWRELVPERLREQFWDRQHRIRQLTILADKDAVPWELLYPMDPGHDAGFLVEQFPVTRAVFGRRPARGLNLWPARFVLPEGSPSEAQDEVEAIRRLLGQDVRAAEIPESVISALTPLQDLIDSGHFGLLHFACHNTYDPAAGSSITLDRRQFTPTLMTTAVIGRVLARSAPTVFINACRSAGLAATYNRLDGWASKFLDAGAAAFIGSLWAVCDGTAREFAADFYGRLQAGSSLGKAVMHARQAAASQPGDPTWLAYTVYGDPRATITQVQP
jgi:tetratricopeptide (TPR) repeat protein